MGEKEENNFENTYSSRIIIHKDNSLKRLDLSFIKHIILKEYKTSELLAYWINDFANYHDNEKKFEIAKSGIYKRGDVVKVNLGFNIGNELGGLHYCIVINKYDNTRNGILNVIPISSKKSGKEYSSNTVNIGFELYEKLYKNLKNEKEKINKILEESKEIEKNDSDLNKYLKLEIKYLQKMEFEISKMNNNSIALINQITSISKQRIYKDKIMKNIRLSKETLDLIDLKISKILLH